LANLGDVRTTEFGKRAEINVLGFLATADFLTQGYNIFEANSFLP
jgi:hypothetical protein